MSKEIQLFDERSRETFERFSRGVRSGDLAPALMVVRSSDVNEKVVLPEIIQVARGVIQQHRSRAALHLLIVKGEMYGVVVELLSRRTISCLVDYARHFEADLSEALRDLAGNVYVYNPLVRMQREPLLPEPLKSAALTIAAEFIPALRGRRRRGIAHRVIRHKGVQYELIALRRLPKT